MTWLVKYEAKAKKQIEKLPQQIQIKIVDKLQEIALLSNPRNDSNAKPLSGKFKGYWRYRVGNYRIICDILDDELVVLVVKVKHRKEVYKH